jgi:uncharacterized OsmC-like protein
MLYARSTFVPLLNVSKTECREVWRVPRPNFTNGNNLNDTVTAKVIYEGGLQTAATHLNSGTVIETDAPVDNGGQGSKFSPTDLVASALASCMLTLMALAAQKRNINLGRIECDVEKVMVANPRRIGQIKVNMIIHGPNEYSDHERSLLERAALTCPVYESLHPDLVKTVLFIWP